MPYRVAPRCEQRAYLALHGEGFDPDEMTAAIGLTPTRTYRAGDPARVPGRPRRTSDWYLDVPVRETQDTEAVVVELLDLLEPHVDRITAAQRRWDLHAVVEVVTEAYSGRYEDGGFVRLTPAVAFAAITLQRLARLNALLDIDQYIIDETDEPD